MKKPQDEEWKRIPIVMAVRLLLAVFGGTVCYWAVVLYGMWRGMRYGILSPRYAILLTGIFSLGLLLVLRFFIDKGSVQRQLLVSSTVAVFVVLLIEGFFWYQDVRMRRVFSEPCVPGETRVSHVGSHLLCTDDGRWVGTD